MTVVKPAFLNLPATASSTEPQKDSRVHWALRTPFPRTSPQIPARHFRRAPVRGLSYLPSVLGSPRAQGLPGEAVSPGRQGQREEGSHPFLRPHQESPLRLDAHLGAEQGCPPAPTPSATRPAPLSLAVPHVLETASQAWVSQARSPLRSMSGARWCSSRWIQRVSLQRVLGVGGFSL